MTSIPSCSRCCLRFRLITPTQFMRISTPPLRPATFDGFISWQAYPVNPSPLKGDIADSRTLSVIYVRSADTLQNNRLQTPCLWHGGSLTSARSFDSIPHFVAIPFRAGAGPASLPGCAGVYHEATALGFVANKCYSWGQHPCTAVVRHPAHLIHAATSSVTGAATRFEDQALK